MKRLVILIFVLNALLLALMVPGRASAPWIAAEGLVLAALVAGLLLRIGEMGSHVAGRYLAAGLACMAVIGLTLPAQLVGGNCHENRSRPRR